MAESRTNRAIPTASPESTFRPRPPSGGGTDFDEVVELTSRQARFLAVESEAGALGESLEHLEDRSTVVSLASRSRYDLPRSHRDSIRQHVLGLTPPISCTPFSLRYSQCRRHNECHHPRYIGQPRPSIPPAMKAMLLPETRGQGQNDLRREDARALG